MDVILLCFCVLTGDDADAVVAALPELLARYGKPVLVARTGAEHLAPFVRRRLRDVGVPVYPTPARAVAAAAALFSAGGAVATADATRGAAAAGSVPPRPGATEAQLKALLCDAGIRVPRGRVITDADRAAAAVVEAGGRAVLKLIAPGLLHKTEAGGVVLDVTPRAAPRVAARLLGLPGATGVLVEEQLPGGVELLVGIAPSPLGPTLALGAGGVLTELLDDVAVRLLPVTEADIRHALAETRVARLLAGFRDHPPADTDALVALVARVAALAAGWPGSLDLNPVLVGERGAVVLDAAYLPEVS